MALRDFLGRCPLIAILRGVRPEEVLEIAGALEGAGIAIIEVPLNSPRPLESIRTLSQWEGGRVLVGAGTVMTPEDVDQVAEAGGKLIVTPHAANDVVLAAKRRGMIACPGFFTPAEAFAMLRDGADGLKLFPAEAGSPAMLRAVRAVLPGDTMVLPVGGIDAGNMGPWLDAGAAGFGIGGAIFRPGDTAAMVGQKAARLVAALPPRAP
jgi:2-dehydro-3-deoxyphosphogalactonate aldolase